MNYSLIAVALFAVFGFTSANAQIANPDNDSATFFKWNAASVNNPKAATDQPKAGDLSSDRLYVYANDERGFVARGHDYEWIAGGLAHTADCLPYNLPAPAKGGSIVQTGPFADHGA
jgi:hypothetical protein